jgi:hypothetical protein
MAGTIDGLPVEQPLQPDLHDRISIQYQLMRDLLNDELRDQYSMYDIDEVKILNVKNVGTQNIKTPAGSFEAVGIQHQAEGSSRTTTLWCVESLDFLPVVIEQHRKGKLKLRATLRSYTALSPPE